LRSIRVLRLDRVYLLIGVLLQALHDRRPDCTLQVGREEQEYHCQANLRTDVRHGRDVPPEAAGVGIATQGQRGAVEGRADAEEREDHEGAERPLEEARHRAATIDAHVLARLAVQPAAGLTAPRADVAGQAADGLDRSFATQQAELTRWRDLPQASGYP